MVLKEIAELLNRIQTHTELLAWLDRVILTATGIGGFLAVTSVVITAIVVIKMGQTKKEQNTILNRMRNKIHNDLREDINKIFNEVFSNFNRLINKE